MRGVLASFDVHVFTRYLLHPTGAFWRALTTTVVIAVAAQVMGSVIGLVSALAWISRVAPIRWLSYLYVTIVRGIPALVMIFLVYFGLPLYTNTDLFPAHPHLFGLAVSGAALAGIVALGINEGAYMSEIIRAGIISIDPGQMEAAKSLGMTRRLAMRRIVLPQAARVIVPPLGNEFNSMLKSTALVATIGANEIFNDATIHYAASFKAEFFAGVAVWYIALTTLWTLIQTQIERRLARSEREEMAGEGSWFTRTFGFGGQRIGEHM